MHSARHFGGPIAPGKYSAYTECGMETDRISAMSLVARAGGDGATKVAR